MRSTYITAIVIAAAIAVWLYSGTLDGDQSPAHPTLAEANRASAANIEDRALTRVRVERLVAEARDQEVLVRGRTEHKRTVAVRTETTGRIIERPVELGSFVEAGAPLCRLSVEDRAVARQEAEASLEEARLQYEGSLKLKKRGLQSDTAVATAKARLAAAQTTLRRAELELDRSIVRAPFSGLVEATHMEVGDYATPGAECVTIVDLDPMVMTGRISERDALALAVGQRATATLLTGRVVTGEVTFVGQQADVTTRTYPLEIEIDNSDGSLRSGVTAQITVAIGSVSAHRISPAVLALDDEGLIGVRTIDDSNRVLFHHVDVVAEEAGGVWVTGLPERTRLITVGQELVVPGEVVDPMFEPGPEMPASAPGNSATPNEVDAPEQGATLHAVAAS